MTTKHTPQISAERLARVKNQYSGFYMQTDEKWEWWAEQLAHHARNVHALEVTQ